MDEMTDPNTLLKRWDKVFTSPIRFTITAAISRQDTVSFSALRRILGISSALMSKHVSVLEGAGYVDIHKIQEGRKVLTELELTPQGRAAFDGQVALLEEISGTHQGDGPNEK